MTYIVALALIYLGWTFFRKKKSGSSASSSQTSLPHSSEGLGQWKVGNPSAAPTPAPPAERPFGEDITNPDARMIPSTLLGRWAISGAADSDILVLEPDHIITPAGNERVIAVRFIGEDAGLETNSNVAVVSRAADEQYALRYFGLAADDSLVDLESTDVVRQRVR